ncbi:MAG: bifunctional oligoribonuclease/PAP phosphatase NrnA [Planctomycetes bacterium]|nr:bifunctional oligoribonuclease/PAP phosphatase NrnA [Planctomycetota bacterium]
MGISWTAFGDLVSGYSRFVLTCHHRPDCDALGSELGMAGLLESLGKDVRIVNPQSTPPNLAFIDPERRIRAIHHDASPESLADREVLIILDTSAWAQLGAMADIVRNLSIRKLVVDHHVGEDDLGAELFKDTGAEATGRLVYDAARALNVPIDAAIAMPLFAAVATDTGWFRFPSTSPATFACAADLVRAGARPNEIYNALYEQDTHGRMLLRGRVLARIAIEEGGELAHTFVVRTDFQETGSLPSDTEDLVNAALGVLGTRVAVILVELPDGRFKVSFRSRGALDCNRVASMFGGGGHRAAAGATVDGPLDDARRRVLDAVREGMR